eukprot:TRINITY_DN5900_c0_g1_i1.p1 TRINITY_DN5900_c0_g1~~TRINITY_DN5900_c0_g1_i1.p1  ORF type:complete len:142 (-),score=36.17 TRINITY_DN5900_c0_g1_i1:41-466(-)
MFMKSFLIVLIAVFSLVVAQTTYDVIVAPNGNLVFDPTSLNVRVGDTIFFKFNSSGHNVRETIGNTCVFNLNGFKSPAAPDAQAPGSTYSFLVGSAQFDKTIYTACGFHCDQNMKFRFTVSPSSTITISALVILLISMLMF